MGKMGQLTFEGKGEGIYRKYLSIFYAVNECFVKSMPRLMCVEYPKILRLIDDVIGFLYQPFLSVID